MVRQQAIGVRIGIGSYVLPVKLQKVVVVIQLPKQCLFVVAAGIKMVELSGLQLYHLLHLTLYEPTTTSAQKDLAVSGGPASVWWKGSCSAS